MKIRLGFVSNSSSSSYVIGTCYGCGIAVESDYSYIKFRKDTSSYDQFFCCGGCLWKHLDKLETELLELQIKKEDQKATMGVVFDNPQSRFDMFDMDDE